MLAIRMNFMVRFSPILTTQESRMLIAVIARLNSKTTRLEMQTEAGLSRKSTGTIDQTEVNAPTVIHCSS